MHHCAFSQTIPFRALTVFFRCSRLVWRGLTGRLRWKPTHGAVICDDYNPSDPELDSILDPGQLPAGQQTHGGETRETGPAGIVQDGRR